MEDKRFQHRTPPPPEKTEENWRDVLYGDEDLEEMMRILDEIDYLVDLQEAPFRLRFPPRRP
jgi:hypothetical protein